MKRYPAFLTNHEAVWECKQKHMDYKEPYGQRPNHHAFLVEQYDRAVDNMDSVELLVQDLVIEQPSVVGVANNDLCRTGFYCKNR